MLFSHAKAARCGSRGGNKALLSDDIVIVIIDYALRGYGSLRKRLVFLVAPGGVCKVLSSTDEYIDTPRIW